MEKKQVVMDSEVYQLLLDYIVGLGEVVNNHLNSLMSKRSSNLKGGEKAKGATSIAEIHSVFIGENPDFLTGEKIGERIAERFQQMIKDGRIDRKNLQGGDATESFGSYLGVLERTYQISIALYKDSEIE